MKNTRKAISFILTLAIIVTMLVGIPMTVFAGTLSTVYLGGTTGSDSNDGASASTPVATFTKAKALLADAGTINLSSLKILAADSEVWSLSDNPDATVVEDQSKTVSIQVIGSLTLSAIRFLNPSTSTTSTKYMLLVGVSGDNGVLTLDPGTNISAAGIGAAVRVSFGVLNIGSGVSLSGGSLGNVSISTDGRIKITDHLTNNITIGLVTAMRAEGTVIGSVVEGITDISKLAYQPSSGGEQRYFIINENNEIVVTATAPTTPIYSITASAVTTGGSISPSGVTAVPEGNSQSYTITPAEGYYISDITVDGATTDAAIDTGTGIGTYTFGNIATNHAIAAAFALIPPPALTVSESTLDFNVGIDCRIGTMPDGMTVTITNNSASAITLAEPESTTYFAVGLSDTDVPAGGSVTMTVTPSAAKFIDTTGHIKSEYTGALSTANPEDTYTDVIAVRTADGKTSIPVTANFNVCYAKTVTIVSTDHGSIRVYINDGCLVKASGGVVQYPSPANFLDVPSGGGEEVTILAFIRYRLGTDNDYQSAEFRFNPDVGYHGDTFIVYSDEHPTGSTLSTDELRRFQETIHIDSATGKYYQTPSNVSNERIVATFAKNTYAITSSAITSGGSISPGGSVEYGTDRAFAITPDLGYHIEDNVVFVDGEATDAAIAADTGIGTYTFTGIAKGHEIAAAFAPNHYTVAFDKNSADAAGTMAAQAGIYGVSLDTSPCAFTLEGKKFLGWATSSGSGIASYPDKAKVNIATTLDNETVTLYAIWANDAYTITSSGSAIGGDITAGGKVGYGTDATFTITPQAGYHIYEVRLDTRIYEVGVDTEPAGININPDTGIGTYTFHNVTAEHAIEARFKANSYTIAFEKNASDATGTMERQTGLAYGTPATLLPCEFSRNGYIFAGWSTSGTATAAAYSDKGPANIATTLDGETVTLYAVWSLPSSPAEPSGPSGGGGGGAVPAMASYSGAQKVVIITSATAETDTAGKATASVDKGALSAALEQAVKAAGDADAKAGNKSGTTGAEVKVEVRTGANATAVETSLPADTLKEMSQQTNTQLTVSTPLAEITLDQKALAAIAGQAGGEVTLSVERLNASALPEEARQKVGDAPVYDLKVLGANGAVTSFNGGTATVSVPYELKPGESADQVTVYYIDSAGNLVKMNCVYDAATKTARFPTDHFSYYAVVVEKGTDRFTDVSKTAWYYDAVSFAVGKGLFNGTSETAFSPNAGMTRAMFVTVLGRAGGVKAEDYTASGFSDVTAGSWYGGYVQWAYENKIISGVGGGKFAPDQAVTREQMASILTNYCKWKGETVSVAETKLSYPDAGQISGWAAEGASFCSGKGWLTGYPDGSFQPRNTATRAEVATVLYKGNGSGLF
jgi:uncharacterized repeat protein (TIGR02543 family)